MRRAFGVLAVALAGVLAWAQGSFYQWVYDLYPLGPGFRAHAFANDTGAETVGLVVELSGSPGRVEWLVLGGHLDLGDLASERVRLVGRVGPGGVAALALPEGLRPLRVAWITATGEVPVEVESPIPRVRSENLVLVEAVAEESSEEDSEGFQRLPHDWWDMEKIVREPVPPAPKPNEGIRRRVIGLWLPELAEWSEWLTYPYLVRLSAKDSFSPLGVEVVSWTWLWEDGVLQVGPEVVRGFDRPGWHRFTLVVRDAAGREQSLRRFVLIFGDEPQETPQTEPADGVDPSKVIEPGSKDPEESREREPPPPVEGREKP